MCAGCRSTTVMLLSLCWSMAADQTNSTNLQSASLSACLVSASKFLIGVITITPQQGVFLSQLLHLISFYQPLLCVVFTNTHREEGLSWLPHCVKAQHNVLAALQRRTLVHIIEFNIQSYTFEFVSSDHLALSDACFSGPSYDFHKYSDSNVDCVSNKIVREGRNINNTVVENHSTLL